MAQILVDLPGLDDLNDVRLTHMKTTLSKAKLIIAMIDKNLEASGSLCREIEESGIIGRVKEF
jgi:hypothetical protein